MYTEIPSVSLPLFTCFAGPRFLNFNSKLPKPGMDFTRKYRGYGKKIFPYMGMFNSEEVSYLGRLYNDINNEGTVSS